MTGEPISLDELLGRQSSAGVRSTVEEVPDQPDRVKVTPFVPDVGCLCHHAFTVPRDAIASVTPTGETHDCCGKTLMVVELAFADPVLNDVYRQVGASVRRVAQEGPAARAGAAPHMYPEPAAPSWWGIPRPHGRRPEPRTYYCDYEHRFCLDACGRLYRPGTPLYRRCAQDCDDALDECYHPGHLRYGGGGPRMHGAWPEPRDHYCDHEHRLCLDACGRLYRPGTPLYRRCAQDCDDALDECYHPGHRPYGC